MAQALAPVRLRCEYLVNPLGIEAVTPRLSWELQDARRGAAQTAYQIVVATEAEVLADDTGNAWDSGRVASSQSNQVLYKGQTPTSRRRYWWKVRTWDANNEVSPWSEPAFWEMGILAPESWAGEWISCEPRDSSDTQPSPYLRRTLEVGEGLAEARLFATARGLYECYLNGQRVGDDVLTPGWTDYKVRIPYQVYDVTKLLQVGQNAWGAILGEGWYMGYLAFQGNRCTYGDHVSFLGQLVLTYDDGRKEIVATDKTWRVTTDGPILASDLYMGESYDARREFGNWAEAAFDDSGWQRATIVEGTTVRLCHKLCDNVQVINELEPLAITEPTPGAYVVDFGQNLVGWPRVTLTGEAGQTVTIRHAEMLNDDGSVYTENLRAARATDHYTLSGEGPQTFAPRFTFHGFRYIEITGLDQAPAMTDLLALVVHTACPPTGTFACSNDKVNQLQSNIVWGQKGNFLEVPTDCPQRDERLGWTGDAQVFVRTACWNLDVASFFVKWARDTIDAQREDGAVPAVIPDVGCGFGACAWADAAVICPWTIYLCYGDLGLLECSYDCMASWVRFMEEESDNLIRPESGYGDWLAIDAVSPGRAPTPKALIGTAYFARCAAIMAHTARLLGKEDEATRYVKLAQDVRDAFNREFVTPAGRVVGHTQTGYLLALGFELLPHDKRPVALQHLVDALEGRNVHLSTGFVGTPLLAPVLSQYGRTDLAYKLLLQEDYPSWLYTVNNGATTMWERWNSYTREHGFGEVAMNSFNHYAYGSIGEWMYARIAGIDVDPEAPGYRHIVLHPEPGGGLTWAKGSLHSIYGPIASGWELKGDGARFDFTIPANTRATVNLPASGLREGSTALEDVEGVSDVREEDGATVFELAAGTYAFVAAKVCTV